MRRCPAAVLRTAALALLVPGPVLAVPPSLVVEGDPVFTPLSHPERIGAEWFLPAYPVCQALGVTLEFEPQTLRITVDPPGPGDTRSYDGITGEIRDGETVMVRLGPGLAVGGSVVDLLVPASLLAALLDVSVVVNAEETEIAISPREALVAREGSDAFGVQALTYHGHLHHYRSSTQGGLNVEGRARVGDGRLGSNALTSFADDQSLIVRRFQATYEEGTLGRTWSVGDLRGDHHVAWLDAFGRGARVGGDHGGGQRYALSALWLARGNGGDASDRAPRHDDGVIAASYDLAAPEGGGAAVSFGGAWVGGTGAATEKGFLFASQLTHRTPRLLARATTGVFFRPVNRSGRNLGVDLVAQWNPFGRASLNARAAHFGRYLRLPAEGFAETGSDVLSLSGSVATRPWMTLSGAVTAHHRHRGADDRLSSATVSVFPGTRTLSSAAVTVGRTWVEDRDAHPENLHLDLRGHTPVGSWFVSSRTRLDGDHDVFTATGLTVRSGWGTGQISSSWRAAEVDGLAFFWTPPVPALRRVDLTLGARWARSPAEDGEEVFTSIRLGTTFGPSGAHRAELTSTDQTVATMSRLAMRGKVVLGEGRSLDPYATGRRALVGDVSSLEGRVYLDRNLDGAFGDGDRPLRGVELQLDDGMRRVRTDEEGRYEFRGLSAGSHVVRITPTTLRADLSLLGSLERRLAVPPMASLHLDLRTAINRTLTGVVFEDRNRNGRRDEDEPGVPDAHLTVAGGGDTLTQPDGRFRMGDVPPGRHAIVVDGSSLEPRLVVGDPVPVMVGASRDPESVSIPVAPRQRPTILKSFDGGR